MSLYLSFIVRRNCEAFRGYPSCGLQWWNICNCWVRLSLVTIVFFFGQNIRREPKHAARVHSVHQAMCLKHTHTAPSGPLLHPSNTKRFSSSVQHIFPRQLTCPCHLWFVCNGGTFHFNVQFSEVLNGAKYPFNLDRSSVRRVKTWLYDSFCVCDIYPLICTFILRVERYDRNLNFDIEVPEDEFPYTVVIPTRTHINRMTIFSWIII